MESLLQIIVLFAFVRFSCRATFFRSLKGIGVFALVVAVVSFACYPIVIEQSGDFYTTLLKDKTLVGNVAVLITLEAIAGMLLSIGLLNTLFVGKKKSRLKWLQFLPEVLIIGAILYAEQQMFYAFPGLDFGLTAGITAGIFALGVGFLAVLIDWAVPENSGRYELNFLVNVFLFCVAILLNAGLSSYNTGSYQSDVQWLSMAVFLAVIVLLVALGFGLYRLKLKNKKTKKILQWI
ncbi:MAG: hypothetical protein KGV44_14095 [Flavobacteriaceae bacterium]|nr:hypothetical protein [Flavobacteriaceae bacterium]